LLLLRLALHTLLPLGQVVHQPLVMPTPQQVMEIVLFLAQYLQDLAVVVRVVMLD
jgi:hypothetical protein